MPVVTGAGAAFSAIFFSRYFWCFIPSPPRHPFVLFLFVKVVNVSTSKTGKHGHAKANFTATDIFTGKKLEDVIPSTHTTSVPVVSRGEYQLLDISDDGFCSLLTGAL